MAANEIRKMSRDITHALAEMDIQIMISQLSLMKFLSRKFGPLSGPTDSPALRARAGKWLEFLKENEGNFPKMVQQLAARKLIEQLEETLK